MNTRLHEDLHRKHQTKGFSDRSFAVTFCVFFGLLALAPLRRHQPVNWRWMIASAVFLVVGLVAPGLLHPVSRAWAKLALLLHKVVNPITTAVLYFLIFVPAGFLFRMMGKDPLRLRLEPNAESYWIPRDSAGAASGSMRNQF